MSYFLKAHHNAILSMTLQNPRTSDEQEQAFNRVVALHQKLYDRIKRVQFDLHTNPESRDIVTLTTAASAVDDIALTLSYTRSRDNAERVESMMGRDGISTSEGVRTRHHPVIEVRISPEHVAVELVVAPVAWYDQRNFSGKITVHEHRDAFYKLLKSLNSTICLGFWSGVHLSDMHLETTTLPPKSILFDFIQTFATGRDWLRFGCWYPAEDERLSEDTIIEELFTCIIDLYQIYTFIAWTSDNNYQTFYHKAATR